MEEALSCLLSGVSFDEVLNEYQLNKYELLSFLHKEILAYRKNFDLEQQEELKSIYLECYSMFDLTNQKVAFVSDTHFASKYENTLYFPVVLDYCRNHGIFYLFHGGDIGDGLVEAHRNYQTPEKQINHIISVYPDDKNICQYVLAGNHDAKYLKHGYDLLQILSMEKENIFPLGYFQAYFTIFGCPISFNHHPKTTSFHQLVDSSFSISGHAHKSRFCDNFIKLPTLSDDIHMKSDPAGIPGFVVMDMSSYGVHFDLNFSRYSFSNLEVIKEESYTYQITKRK